MPWAACLLATALLLSVAVAPEAGVSHVSSEPAVIEQGTAKLNVHIVCHSHDDAGWLKTVDQYFYGANNTIQVAGVQYILDTVVQELAANPSRKFVYGELAFFMRWWSQQDEDTQAMVTRLVQDGQLEFVNGGYVQHDEATAHYVGMIDQTTRGHMFLLNTFGVVPRVGWQIDPFGHSATQAGLLSAHVGFDALFFGRADYQDMEHRKNLTAMEMVWQGSPTLEDASVFTGNFISGNYGPPEGFAFEWACPPIMDDPRFDEYNVKDRVNAFVEQCRAIAAATRGPDIMLTMGSDFQYANAHLQFKNLDKLIRAVNADGRISAFYSTPAEYVHAKHAYDKRWPLKQDDFFPYADFPHAYWTGYFTSRPASKGYIRSATSYLQAARQLEAFIGVLGKEGGPTSEALEEAVSLLQHHDAITGTEKQHVACDYHRRLHRGLKEAQLMVTSGLETLIRGQYGRKGRLGGSAMAGQQNVLIAAETGAAGPRGAASASQRRRLQQGQPNPVDTPINLEVCNWLNITACNTTVHLSSEGKGFMVAAYNPLGWSREAPLRVPVNTSATCTWHVTGPEGEEVDSQLVPATPSTWCLQRLLADVNDTDPAAFGDAEVVFVARLPPLGYSTFFVQPRTDSCTKSRDGSRVTRRLTEVADLWGATASGLQAAQQLLTGSSAEEKAERYGTLDNGAVRLQYDLHTGLLHSMSVQGATVKLSTTVGWYNSSDGLESQENRGQASGAYIFRPNGFYELGGSGFNSGWWSSLWGRLSHTAGNQGAAVQLQFVRGETVLEARQVFAGWATLVTRLYRGKPQVEMEWTVGPIPFEDGLGREVVLQYTSDVESGDEFWTDANGREMIKRIRDSRPSWDLNVTEPVAGNFYPLTAAMYIQDADRQLTVLTDRAQGGASLRSGQMEVMVHRRTLADDARGVAEPLNETACGCTNCNCPGLVVRGKHWLVLAPRHEAAKPRRTLQQELNDPPLLAFSAIPRQIGSLKPRDGRVGLRRTFSLSEGHVLHSNVHLLTLKDTGDSYLVRLAHLYQEGEDPGLSRPVTENLNAVLQLLRYSEVRELSLSGNQLRSSMQNERLRFQAGDSLTNSSWLDEGAATDARWLKPHQKGLDSASGVVRGSKQDQVLPQLDVRELSRLREGARVIDCSSGCSNGELLVTLKPMEVRTFELIYRPYQRPGWQLDV